MDLNSSQQIQPFSNIQQCDLEIENKTLHINNSSDQTKNEILEVNKLADETNLKIIEVNKQPSNHETIKANKLSDQSNLEIVEINKLSDQVNQEKIDVNKSSDETKLETIRVIKPSNIKNFQDIKHFLASPDHSYPLPNINYHTIAIAPMIDITDVHFRNLMRLLTRYSVLYTEMVHEQAVYYNIRGPEEFLRFDPVQHPIVIQLGGNDPDKLARAAKICEKLGYDEINLNVGCPSDRVQTGKFGACLMKEPKLVSEIMKKISESCSIPCTVKCRLGVDNFDSYEFARDFIKEVSENGNVKHFIVHARKAHLKGLNPAQNRNIPPLKYDYVIRLKKEFPHLSFSINGGFKTYEAIEEILKLENGLTGCMIGRAAYDNPWFFSDVDRRFYGKKNLGFSRREILKIWGQYGKLVLEKYPNIGIPTLNKPIIHMFAGEKGCARYRQSLSEKLNLINSTNYEDHIKSAIQRFEIFNTHSLDERPIGCEDVDNSIADAIFNSIKNEQKQQNISISDSKQDDPNQFLKEDIQKDIEKQN